MIPTSPFNKYPNAHTINTKLHYGVDLTEEEIYRFIHFKNGNDSYGWYWFDGCNLIESNEEKEILEVIVKIGGEYWAVPFEMDVETEERKSLGQPYRVKRTSVKYEPYNSEEGIERERKNKPKINDTTSVERLYKGELLSQDELMCFACDGHYPIIGDFEYITKTVDKNKDGLVYSCRSIIKIGEDYWCIPFKQQVTQTEMKSGYGQPYRVEPTVKTIETIDYKPLDKEEN